MRFDFSPHQATIQTDTIKDSSNPAYGKWGKATLAVTFLVFAAATLIPGTTPVFANDASSWKVAATQRNEKQFDWILHTRQTLEELKGTLNLTSGQVAAWDIWSDGIIKDGQQQLARKDNRRKASIAAKDSSGGTTPERMAQGIEHLRIETAWMQEHLTQLEAAQVRTSTFYEALDINQKTIFDLFWHEMYHRVSGHDLGGNLPGYRYRPPMT